MDGTTVTAELIVAVAVVVLFALGWIAGGQR